MLSDWSQNKKSGLPQYNLAIPVFNNKQVHQMSLEQVESEIDKHIGRRRAESGKK